MDAIEYYRMVQIQDGRAPNTLKTTTAAIKRFFKYINKPVDEVTQSDVREWLSSLEVSKNTQKIYLSSLNIFYTIIIESEMYDIVKNPVSIVLRRQKTATPDRKRPEKTITEVSVFLRSIRHIRDRTVFTLLAKTGIRAGEAVCLTVNDYNADAGTLTINKHAGTSQNRAADVREGRKNGINTIIPIDAELAHGLNIYLKATGKAGDDMLFSADSGRLQVARVEKRFSVWAKKTGFRADGERGITPHYFRHFLTYQLLANDCNFMVVDYIRGDVAGDIKNHYARQVLPFDKIRSEYLKAVPQLGL